MNAAANKPSLTINLENSINEVEAVLLLIGEAYQKVLENELGEEPAAAGLQQMRWGAIERLRNAADALIYAKQEGAAA
jgi:hypothetical protein